MAAALAVKLAALCGCSGAIAQEQPNATAICGGDVIARGVAKLMILFEDVLKLIRRNSRAGIPYLDA